MFESYGPYKLKPFIDSSNSFFVAKLARYSNTSNRTKFGKHTIIGSYDEVDYTEFDGRGQAIYRIASSHYQNTWIPHVHAFKW